MTVGSCSTWAIGSLRATGGVKRRRIACRELHDFVRGSTQGGKSSSKPPASADECVGTYKVPLSSPKIVGTYSSRGSRLYFTLCTVQEMS
jgi:hypothetical protein